MSSVNNIPSAAKDCLTWLEKNMLAPGANGIYERIRTDKNETVRLCRPDTASEFLYAVLLYGSVTGDKTFDRYLAPMTNWLLSSQLGGKNDGAFPFFTTEKTVSPRIYQNDNGKVLINLLLCYKKTGNVELLIAAKRCGRYWLKRQKRRGNYYGRRLHLQKKVSYGPCFLLWLAAGMALLGDVTEDKRYTLSAYRAFALLRSQTKDGRILTSYEVTKDECWRPVSSENYIALLCYAIGYKATGDRLFLAEAERILPFCESLLTEGGAIANGTPETMSASKNNDVNICDFVYTMGYGLNALISLYEVTGKRKFLDYAKKVASFALDVQCKENDPIVDGGWRGSFNKITKIPEGRCNQDNQLDEGGVYSLYAGWCALPITTGLLRLIRIITETKQ